MLDSEDTFTQDGDAGSTGSASPRAGGGGSRKPTRDSDSDDSDSDVERAATAAAAAAAAEAAVATSQAQLLAAAADASSAVVVSLEDVRAVQPPPASPAAYGFEYGSPFSPQEVVAGLVCTAWMPALNRHVRSLVTDVHVKSAADKVGGCLALFSRCTDSTLTVAYCICL